MSSTSEAAGPYLLEFRRAATLNGALASPPGRAHSNPFPVQADGRFETGTEAQPLSDAF
jgi:hypothetical protein